MSCQLMPIQNQSNVSGNEDNGMFATLDTAFNKSEEMAQFQNRIQNCNINPTNNEDKVKTDLVNDNLQNLISHNENKVDKMDSSIDEVIGSIYASSVPKCLPIDRSTRFSAQKYGTELLEGYSEAIAQPPMNRNSLGPMYNNNLQGVAVNRNSNMSIFKLLLLVLLVAALVYGGYHIYKNSNRQSIEYADTATGTTAGRY